jgi:hypothetical protein
MQLGRQFCATVLHVLRQMSGTADTPMSEKAARLRSTGPSARGLRRWHALRGWVAKLFHRTRYMFQSRRSGSRRSYESARLPSNGARDVGLKGTFAAVDDLPEVRERYGSPHAQGRWTAILRMFAVSELSWLTRVQVGMSGRLHSAKLPQMKPTPSVSMCG